MPKETISEFGNRSIEFFFFLNQSQMEKNNENIQNRTIKNCVTWAIVIFAKF